VLVNDRGDLARPNARPISCCERGNRLHIAGMTRANSKIAAPQVRCRALWTRAALAQACLVLASFAFVGCGYNEVIDRDEEVKASWAEVQNQYKRRADLVPNLVKVVQGSANFERDTLQKVIEARSNVAGIKVDSSVIDDPQKLAAFEAAQNKLSGALSRLLVVSEKYPDLKASDAFRDLQAQLEGTENRIAVARGRYIATVADYNKTVLRFPTSLGASMRGKHERPTFSGSPDDEKPPEIKL
jgi:LemA protein